MRALLVAALACGACTSFQSSRVIAPGKSRFTVAAQRTNTDSDETASYAGIVQYDWGTAGGREYGFHFARTAGPGAFSAAGFDMKFQTSKSATGATAFTLPLSVGWQEQGLDASKGFLALEPGFVFGHDVSPKTELVFAPHVLMLYDGENKIYGVGASLGLRVGDDSRSWAIQPQLGVMIGANDSAGASSAALLTLGLGISAGD